MNRPASRTLALLLAATAVVAGIGAGWHALGHPERAQIAAGRALYAEHCAACHGTDLAGQPNWQTPLPNGRMPAPPHDSSGHTWHHTDRELFTVTKYGMEALVSGYNSEMPKFGGILSDQEIRAVLAFIKSQWSERERGYQQEMSRRERGSP